jgi:hypothetical protein
MVARVARRPTAAVAARAVPHASKAIPTTPNSDRVTARADRGRLPDRKVLALRARMASRTIVALAPRASPSNPAPIRMASTATALATTSTAPIASASTTVALRPRAAPSGSTACTRLLRHSPILAAASAT